MIYYNDIIDTVERLGEGTHHCHDNGYIHIKKQPDSYEICFTSHENEHNFKFGRGLFIDIIKHRYYDNIFIINSNMSVIPILDHVTKQKLINVMIYKLIHI